MKAGRGPEPKADHLPRTEGALIERTSCPHRPLTAAVPSSANRRNCGVTVEPNCPGFLRFLLGLTFLGPWRIYLTVFPDSVVPVPPLEMPVVQE